jgi:multiple sugar transport system permease protein
MKGTSRSAQAALHLLLAAGLLIVLYPIIFMAMNSVKQATAISFTPSRPPDLGRLNLDGYRRIAREMSFPRLFLNTAFLVAVLVSLHLAANAAAGYALAKIAFPGKGVMFKIMLWTLMIPGTMLLIPTYVLMSRLSWVDTYLPLILPGVVGVYDIFLIRQFIQGIPNDFIEAAKIDGASHPFIFARIVLPMCVPVLAGVAVILGMSTWNDFQGPLFYLRSQEKFTLQLALFRYAQDGQIDMLPARYAGMTVATVPVIIAFLFAQKYFTRAFGTFSLK